MATNKSYTITEAAKYLGISRAAVHLAIKKGRLNAHEGEVTMRALLIDSKDLKAYQVNSTRQRSGKKS
jgi:excisionase family DNA binding protein